MLIWDWKHKFRACWTYCSFLFSVFILSPIILVQWKTTPNERKRSYWRYTHFSLNHDYGRIRVFSETNQCQIFRNISTQPINALTSSRLGWLISFKHAWNLTVEILAEIFGKTLSPHLWRKTSSFYFQAFERGCFWKGGICIQCIAVNNNNSSNSYSTNDNRQ